MSQLTQAMGDPGSMGNSYSLIIRRCMKAALHAPTVIKRLGLADSDRGRKKDVNGC
ncbi:MAG: hypothetical protein IKH26_11150 [Bacteroidaceae bacterium]|nr:hypothetical protein [Bacteroidaceae bacterium]